VKAGVKGANRMFATGTPNPPWGNNFLKDKKQI
jgi:hypothetical protein